MNKALLDLIDEYAETRHTCGSWGYNAKTAAARRAVIAALEAESAATVVECGNLYAKVKLTDEAFGTTNVGDKLYLAPAPSAVPLQAIETLMNQAMDQAVANGANSISMPDEIVEVAHWLVYGTAFKENEMNSTKQLNGPWTLGDMTGNWRDIDLPDHGAVMRIVWKMEDDSGRNEALEAQAHAVVAALNAAWQEQQQPIGEVVVTKTPEGEIVAVTRQDSEGRILSVIATNESTK